MKSRLGKNSKIDTSTQHQNLFCDTNGMKSTKNTSHRNTPPTFIKDSKTTKSNNFYLKIEKNFS